MNGIRENQKSESVQSVNQHTGTGLKKKKCPGCQTEKRIERFSKNKRTKDGRNSWCKKCIAEYQKNNPDRKLLWNKNFKEKYPEKYKAHRTANNAVRDGFLIQKACEFCGALETEMHHPDYSKPLQVIWLCHICHLQIHGETQKQINDALAKGGE